MNCFILSCWLPSSCTKDRNSLCSLWPTSFLQGPAQGGGLGLCGFSCFYKRKIISLSWSPIDAPHGTFQGEKEKKEHWLCPGTRFKDARRVEQDIKALIIVLFEYEGLKRVSVCLGIQGLYPGSSTGPVARDLEGHFMLLSFHSFLLGRQAVMCPGVRALLYPEMVLCEKHSVGVGRAGGFVHRMLPDQRSWWDHYKWEYIKH